MRPFCDPADDGDEPTTEKGLPERRRSRYVTRSEFKWWRRRATIAFVALTLVSSLAAYLAYNAGKRATSNLTAAGRDATTKSCLSGVDLRIAVATGLDDLRQLAVSNATEAQRDPFIAITQPSIDRLLSQAAGRPFHAPLPPGTVTASVADQVREQGVQRCQRRTDSSFDSGRSAPSGG